MILVFRKAVRQITYHYNRGRKVGLRGYELECGHFVSAAGRRARFDVDGTERLFYCAKCSRESKKEGDDG